MGHWGVRRTLVVGGFAGLVAVATACSGGSKHLSVAPATTVAKDVSSATSTSVSHATAAGSRKAKTAVKAKGSAGGTTRSGVGASGAATRGAGNTGAGGSTPTTLSPAQRLARALSQGGGTGGGSTGVTVVVTVPTSTGGTTATTVYVPKPYDPSKPIDLGGVPGVTPDEQRRAEQLVRDTLRDLPRYASTATAYADGYRSVGDGFTGTEHFVKWSYIDDPYLLDSQHPESLVYQMRNGVQQLVSAMYVLPTGTRFTDAPDVGGKLTQWHVHGDLCFGNTGDPQQKVISSLTTVDGTCPAGTQKFLNLMLHVWIVANPCGPFAPLEGVGAGQPPPGEQPLCDEVHGSG